MTIELSEQLHCTSATFLSCQKSILKVEALSGNMLAALVSTRALTPRGMIRTSTSVSACTFKSPQPRTTRTDKDTQL